MALFFSPLFTNERLDVFNDQLSMKYFLFTLQIELEIV